MYDGGRKKIRTKIRKIRKTHKKMCSISGTMEDEKKKGKNKTLIFQESGTTADVEVMDEQRAWKARNKASRLLSITTGIEKNLFSLCICVRGHPLCYQQQWCVCVCVCVCMRASE